MPDKTLIHKQFEIKVLDAHKNGGRILINTASLDRDRDRVVPTGGRVDNYLKNPVVQWGHNYRDPWSTIGRSKSLEVSNDGIVADFELRPAANDQDPQNIIRLLWEGGWVRTASIGFIPKIGNSNKEGGTDFTEWELLEWSLVPIPANQDALRLAVKSFDEPEGTTTVKAPCIGCGRSTEFSATLWALAVIDTSLLKCADCAQKDADGEADPGRVWIRRLTIETDRVQTLFANFMTNTVSVPEDAVLLQMDPELGECTEVPHPEAGKTVKFKSVIFIPTLKLANGNEVHTIEQRDQPDEKLLTHNLWKIVELSEPLAALPIEKSMGAAILRGVGLGIDILTARGVQTAHDLRKHYLKALERGKDLKRGRVLSSKNEGKIRAARDNLNEVLAEVEQEPEIDDGKQAQLIEISDANEPHDPSAGPEQATGSIQRAGNDEAGTAAAAERELAEVLAEYFKTIKEVLA